MEEKEKYLRIYRDCPAEKNEPDIVPGKMGGGYGRICWGENMLETLKQWKISSLLDVGCGYGNFCDAAALFIPQVYGLDIASVATQNIINNPQITFLDSEAKNIPLAGNAVQWVTSFDCLEHCLEQDIDTILDEFDRVATRGFVLSISYEPCEMNGMPLHMTVKPESWWIEKLSRYGEVSKEGNAPITGTPYLICRKPVAKKIICYCAGSVGVRLQGLAWADQFARSTGRKLSLLWLKNDPLCQAAFADLFTNPIPEISEEALSELTSCKIYAHVKAVSDQALVSGGSAFRQFVQKWGCASLETLTMEDEEETLVIYTPHPNALPFNSSCSHLIGQLIPTASVMDRIATWVSRLNLGKDVMGVYARGTDFSVDVAAYAHRMAQVLRLNPEQKFLVCSEDRTYEEKLQRQFQRNTAIRRKLAWVDKKDPNGSWALGNIMASKAAVIETVIDLYLLSHSDFRIYHESSALARLATILSDTQPLGETESGQPADPKVAECGQSGLRQHCLPSQLTTHAEADAPDRRKRSEIYYYCPGIRTASAGIRRIYRHVKILNKAGFPAFILHEKSGCEHHDMPRVPVAYMDRITPDARTVVVIPEGFPRIMHQLKGLPCRRFVIALSWDYIFKTLPDGLDWRQLNIERVLTASPVIGKMIIWSMGLPVHPISTSIDHQRYYFDPDQKQARIAYIQRKANNIEKLKALLAARNPDYIRKIEWIGLQGLSQNEYAAEIRRSAIFLTTSTAEGFPTSALEAMAAGTVVAGYDGSGGKGILHGDGAGRNCILAPNGDYPSLAYAMAPYLDDLMQSMMERLGPIITQALRSVSAYNNEAETHALIDFWNRFATGPAVGNTAPASSFPPSPAIDGSISRRSQTDFPGEAKC